MLGWGINGSGQLGIGTITSSAGVNAVDMTGVLAGETVIATAASMYQSLVLCADGTLVTWGATGSGTTSLPILVNTTGVLAGKLPVAITAGESHFLVLCADGTLASWGSNTYGQLGNNSTVASVLPVAVDRSGVLSGKKVAVIAAGGNHSLVLCTDGTLAAWGNNNFGILGDGTTSRRLVPVLVNTSGVLAGMSVIGIAGGSDHSLALCANGRVAAWGRNQLGQLGDTTTTNSYVPVWVNNTGVLAGKTVTAVDAGQYHNLALCSDGSLATWGDNGGGQLGNNTTTQSAVPVAVVQTGVLLGKTVTDVASGLRHNLVLCADGTLASWGQNTFAQLGNSTTTQSNVPTLVDTAALRTGERFAAGNSGPVAFHNLARVASPPPPAATTLAASAITNTGAVLNGRINANGTSTAVTFQYGLTLAYGNSVSGSPATVTGTATTAANATLGSLSPDTIYHRRVRNYTTFVFWELWVTAHD